jgi:hypothetical protein
MTQPQLIYDADAEDVTPAFPVIPAYLAWIDDSGSPQQFRCFVKSEDYELGADVTDHPVETGSNITDNVRVRLREATIMFFETNTPLDSNNWADATFAISTIEVPSPPPQLPPGPTEFESWDNLIIERELGETVVGAFGGLAAGPVGAAVATVFSEVAGQEIVGAGVPVPQIVFPPDISLLPVSVPATYQSQAIGFGSGQDFVALTISKLQSLMNNVQVVSLIAPKLAISDMVIESIHIHRDAETGDAAEIQVGLKEIRFVSTTNVPAPAPSVIRASSAVNSGEINSIDVGAAANFAQLHLAGAPDIFGNPTSFQRFADFSKLPP